MSAATVSCRRKAGSAGPDGGVRTLWLGGRFSARWLTWWLSILFAVVGLIRAEPPRVERSRVRIPVWTNSEQELEKEDITAKVNGQPADIVHIAGPEDPLMLLLILDLVGDLTEIELARKGLIEAVSEAPDNTYIGVMRAQDGLRVLLDPTKDREAVINAIENFPVAGTPALLETIETASELADSILQRAPVRIAICYVTDSDIRDYREDFTNPVINYSDDRDLSRRFSGGLVRERVSKLGAKLGSSQTPIFVVHLERFSDQLNEAYQSGLMQLSTATGGETVFCRSNAEIPAAIQSTFRKIVSHYGLDLVVGSGNGDSAEISLEASDKPLSYRSRVYLKKR